MKEMIVHGHNCGRAQATGQYFMGVEERDFELHYHDNGGSVRGGSDRFTEFALPWHRNSDVDYTRRDDEQEEHNEGDSSEQALIRWEDFSVLVEDTDDDDDEGDWEDESDEGDGEDADVEEGDEDVNENEEPIDGGETDAE